MGPSPGTWHLRTQLLDSYPGQVPSGFLSRLLSLRSQICSDSRRPMPITIDHILQGEHRAGRDLLMLRKIFRFLLSSLMRTKEDQRLTSLTQIEEREPRNLHSEVQTQGSEPLLLGRCSKRSFSCMERVTWSTRLFSFLGCILASQCLRWVRQLYSASYLVDSCR